VEKFRTILSKRNCRRGYYRDLFDCEVHRLVKSRRFQSIHFAASRGAGLHGAVALSPNENKIYELTTERLKTTEGVFSKKTDTLELYRVKDLKTHQPFLYRIVGIENVQVDTTDVSSPSVLIEAVPCAAALDDKVRNNVEAIRVQKGVREIDVE
jgi:hypothetical protein